VRCVVHISVSAEMSRLPAPSIIFYFLTFRNHGKFSTGRYKTRARIEQSPTEDGGTEFPSAGPLLLLRGWWAALVWLNVKARVRDDPLTG